MWSYTFQRLHDAIHERFKKCDEVIQRSLPDSQSPKRLYVFINDVDKLFDERPSRAKQNVQALTAIIDFCKAAATRGGGEPLALRMFIPIQLREPIQKGLGPKADRIRQYTISWSAEHCLEMVERRLRNCWEPKDPGGVYCPLTKEERNELYKWLQLQKCPSPRFVIDTLDQFGHYVYRRRTIVETLIDVQLWREFLRSHKSMDPGGADRPYPLRQLPFLVWKPQRWLWFTILLVLLPIVLYFGSSAFNTIEEIILILYIFVINVIGLFEDILDFIGALILLGAILGATGFFFWLLRERRRSGMPLNLREYFQEVWQVISRYLPGGSQ